MKNKILLLLAIVAILACLFAISVSAETVIPEFTQVIDVTDIGEGVVTPIDTSSLSTLEAVVNDNTSRVLLRDENGNYATYLSKYITTTAKTGAGDYGMKFKFDALNVATGKEYSATSVIRLEIPEGVERFYTATLDGCANLLTVKGGSTFWVVENYVFHESRCPGLKVIDFSASTKTSIKTTVSGVFANNGAIEEVRLPQNIVEMGGTPFHNATSLKKVYFPSTFTKTSSIVNQSTAKCAFFYTGDMEAAMSVFPSTLPTSFTVTLEYVEWDSTKSDDYYVSLAQGHSAADVIYIVYNYSKCEAFYGGEHVSGDSPCVINCTRCGLVKAKDNPTHNESVTIKYGNGFVSEGSKTTACKNEGCTYNTTEKLDPMFTCLGYSAPSYGSGGIAIGFTVNNKAIAEYEELTGKTLKYGVFAVLKDSLGDNDIFGENGTVANGVINAEISRRDFAAFELKIIGFTDEQKNTKLAMGAYVAVTYGETTEYSYMQVGTPGEGEKYCFVSYNDIEGEASEK